MAAHADGAALRNVALLVAYDGTEYHGFAESDGVRTVLGVLRSAVERIVRQPVELTGAGRTDAGVHAWGQVVSGHLPGDVSLDRLAHSLNRMCGPSIVVRDAWPVDADFSARFDATARSYRYDVWNDRVPDPFLARTTWHVPGALDLRAMNAAADRVYRTIRQDGTQAELVDSMQTREQLYDLLDYHQHEKRMDQLLESESHE